MRMSHGVSDLRQRRDESRLRPADQGGEHAAVSAPPEVPGMRNVVHVPGKSDSRRPAGTDPTPEKAIEDDNQSRVMTGTNDVLLRIRQTRKDVPQATALRTALKRLLRQCGFAVLLIDEVPRDEPIFPRTLKETDRDRPSAQSDPSHLPQLRTRNDGVAGTDSSDLPRLPVADRVQSGRRPDIPATADRPESKGLSDGETKQTRRPFGPR